MDLQSICQLDGTTTASAAGSLHIVASLGLCAVLYAEHRHAIRSSAFLGLFQGIFLCQEIISTRSYFARNLTSLGNIAALTAAIRLALILMDEIPRQHLIIDPKLRKVSKGEATSGFWSRTCFFFLGPMLQLGYHGILKPENLMALGIELSSVRIFSQLSKCWKSINRSKRHALFLTCCWEWRGALFAIFVPRLCATVFTFGQPFSIQRALEVIENGSFDDESNEEIIWAVATAFAGAALCRAVSKHMTTRLITRVRVGLFSMIMDKNMRLKRSYATRSPAITLMNVDFDDIAFGLRFCVDLPFTFLETGLGIYLLMHFVRQFSFVVILPLFLATLVGFTSGSKMRVAKRRWDESIQHRISKTSRILPQLPSIRMLGLGRKATRYIQSLRIQEIEAYKKYRAIQSGLICVATMVDLLCPMIVVATALLWGPFGKSLSPSTIYPTLSIVTLVQDPLTALFRCYPAAMATLCCFERIGDFLRHAEQRDPRTLQNEAANQNDAHLSALRPAKTNQGGLTSSSPALIRFQRVSLTVLGVETPILQDIELSLMPGSITALFGPTGSGKTTFINSILGEVEISSGNIFIDDIAIALVGQSTWLPNISILECIIGSCAYDEPWFMTVVIACNLVQDISQLPGGVRYLVGNDGIALSGGQRQRVSMARAAYCRARLVLFDDSFGALDTRTANKVLLNLCGDEGLFRQSNTTVIISSYLTECLDVADNLIYLDGERNLTFQNGKGSKAFRSRILSLLSQEATPEDDTDASEGDVLVKSSPSAVVSAAQQKPDKKGDGTALYLLYLREIGMSDFLIWAFLSIIHSALESSPRVYLKIWIGQDSSNMLYLVGYSLLPIICGFFTFIGVLFFFNQLCPRPALALHYKLITTVMSSTLDSLNMEDTGSILAKCSLDMDILTKQIPPSLHNTSYYIIGNMVKVYLILSGAAHLSFLLPVILFALVFAQRYFFRTSQQLQHLQLASQTSLISSVRETSQGLVYIRAFGWKEHMLARTLHLLDESEKPRYLLECAQKVLALSFDILAAVLATSLAISSLNAKDHQSANSAGVAFLCLVITSVTLSEMIRGLTSLEMAIHALSRLRSFFSETPTESDEGTISLPENWPSRGEVELSNVSARYRDGAEEPYIIKNVSVIIKAGQKVGITGRSGSGKSSLLCSLLGFFNHQGSIIIDDIDITTAPKDELRAKIITISQDQIELDGSVRENLFPFELVIESDENSKAEEARKDKIARETLVRLRIWDKAAAKKGLKTPLEDVGYSYGEMQLLCIARAVIRRRLTGSRLLLVDEATGGVDRWRDQIVREMMKEYFRGCTIIVVAHREESLADSNVMVEMADGKMNEPRHFH